MTGRFGVLLLWRRASLKLGACMLLVCEDVEDGEKIGPWPFTVGEWGDRVSAVWNASLPRALSLLIFPDWEWSVKIKRHE